MPTTTWSKKVKMIWGLSLHGWEDAMRFSLAVIGIFGLIVGLSTWFVVKMQREEIAASQGEFERYKLEASKEIAESNARQKQAEVKLEQLRKLSGPREIDFDAFKKDLEGKPKAPVAIWYLPDSSDGYSFAHQLWSALTGADWEASRPIPIPEIDEKNIDTALPVTPLLLSELRNRPRAVNAGASSSGTTLLGDGTDQVGKKDTTPLSALTHALRISTPPQIWSGEGSQVMRVPPGTLRVVIAAKSDLSFMDALPSANEQK